MQVDMEKKKKSRSKREECKWMSPMLYLEIALKTDIVKVSPWKPGEQNSLLRSHFDNILNAKQQRTTTWWLRSFLHLFLVKNHRFHSNERSALRNTFMKIPTPTPNPPIHFFLLPSSTRYHIFIALPFNYFQLIDLQMISVEHIVYDFRETHSTDEAISTATQVIEFHMLYITQALIKTITALLFQQLFPFTMNNDIKILLPYLYHGNGVKWSHGALFMCPHSTQSTRLP